LRVAVIGSSGGMGSFFVRYFLSKGHTVSGSDVRPSPISSKGFTFFPSNANAAKDSDLVLIASPIDRTIETAEDCLSVMKKGATLVEISSVKGKILPSVRRLIGRKGVRLLSIHPLFGPTLKPGAEMKMLVVRSGRGGALKLAKGIFPEASLISVEGEVDHDRIVALTLSLTHIVNMLYARTIVKRMSPADFRKLGTPTSAVQVALAEAVLSNDPRLYSYIQTENKESARVIKQLSRELKRVSKIVKTRDRGSFEALYRGLRDDYLRNESPADASSRIYEAFDSLKESNGSK
jgi:prephenate dehydrogenase